jgi:hypothetical protein
MNESHWQAPRGVGNSAARRRPASASVPPLHRSTSRRRTGRGCRPHARYLGLSAQPHRTRGRLKTVILYIYIYNIQYTCYITCTYQLRRLDRPGIESTGAARCSRPGIESTAAHWRPGLTQRVVGSPSPVPPRPPKRLSAEVSDPAALSDSDTHTSELNSAPAAPGTAAARLLAVSLRVGCAPWSGPDGRRVQSAADPAALTRVQARLERRAVA